VSEFIDAVRQNTFLQYALLAGVLASIACGVIGTYIVVRRITYIAGSISHCILGGIGAAVYFQKVHGLTFMTPLRGAIAAALVAAIIIGLVSMRAKQREDTVIGALWAIGMAAGVLFIWKTPGYQQDLMSYLFGNILMVTPEDLWLVACLDVAVIAAGVLFYNPLLALCFDEEFARARGLHVEFYYLFLLCLTALTVVLLVSVVGIVLVIALLTLPVAVAGHLAKRLWHMMVLASVLSIAFTVVGQAIAYSPGLPAGTTIIVLAGAAYLLTAVASRFPRPRKT
jgi:zinc transport system permease protein